MKENLGIRRIIVRYLEVLDQVNGHMFVLIYMFNMIFGFRHFLR